MGFNPKPSTPKSQNVQNTAPPGEAPDHAFDSFHRNTLNPKPLNPNLTLNPNP